MGLIHPEALKKLRTFAHRHDVDILQVSQAEFEALKTPPGQHLLGPKGFKDTPGKTIRRPLRNAHRLRRGFSEAFESWDLGLNWYTRKIYFSDFNEPDLCTFVAGVAHELGHVLCLNAPPDEVPKKGPQEETDFLGWELVLSLQMGLTVQEWCKASEGYIMPVFKPDGSYRQGIMGSSIQDHARYNPRGLAHLLNRCIARSTEFGMIKRGHPVAIRTTRR